ncbi:hypothetical protein JR316_0008724 [Psilocybe cubensis]|uniref:Uncharacterized protein n=1 Tax=Psilocybe cubensis TaxID=181762 RepID=A0ACB8GSR2_PSICU|nr:hypothetical protein JR316_0008724 [Psilocybe cubensis]KAH9478271.1 hypothetical protein JR316_0008724 [Psilocybe cubensis]
MVVCYPSRHGIASTLYIVFRRPDIALTRRIDVRRAGLDLWSSDFALTRRIAVRRAGVVSCVPVEIYLETIYRRPTSRMGHLHECFDTIVEIYYKQKPSTLCISVRRARFGMLA